MNTSIDKYIYLKIQTRYTYTHFFQVIRRITITHAFMKLQPKSLDQKQIKK